MKHSKKKIKPVKTGDEILDRLIDRARAVVKRNPKANKNVLAEDIMIEWCYEIMMQPIKIEPLKTKKTRQK